MSFSPRSALERRVAPLLSALSAEGALPPGWSLAEVDPEQGITLDFRAQGGRVLVELEGVDERRASFARTARFNVYYSLAGARRDIGPAERALLERVVALIRGAEGALPPAPASTPSRRVLLRQIEGGRALVEEGPGAYYLNPYLGCTLGCAFCYASHRAQLTRQLEGADGALWGRFVDVKDDLPGRLADEVLRLAPGTVRMSPIITDPYQPVERRFRVVRRCLEILAPTRFSPIVLTRSAAVVDDIELLARCHQARVGFSVPTDDDGVRQIFEPRADPIDERVEALARARAAGLITFAIVQPMFPQDPARLASLLAPVIEVARVGPLFEQERARDLYERAGRLDAMSDAWQRSNAEALSRELTARGVIVNPTGPRWSMLR